MCSMTAHNPKRRTDHPDLLDPAIHRRFHVAIELPLPGLDDRLKIMKAASGRFAEAITPRLLEACAVVTDGINASDLTRFVQATIRHHLVTGVPLPEAVVSELQGRYGDAATCGMPRQPAGIASMSRNTPRPSPLQSPRKRRLPMPPTNTSPCWSGAKSAS